MHTNASEQVTAGSKMKPSGSSVLVLGATGLIGNAVVHQLLDSGFSVTGTCRRQGKLPKNLDGLDARVVHGDINDPGTLDEWVEGHDVVVDAAAPYPLHLVDTKLRGEQSAIGHAENRTNALIGSIRRHRAKLVHVSTLLAQPARPQASFSGMQKQMMRALHPYFSIKSMIEDRLHEAADTLPGVAIIQPSACLGPYDVKSEEQCLIPKVVRGEMPVAVSHRINVVDTRDVAKGIVASIKQDYFGRTIRLTGHNTSIESLLAEVAGLGGNPAPRLRYPAEFSVLPSYWAEIMWAAIGRESPMPSLLPVLICEQDWMDISAEQLDLDITPRPLGETIEDTVGWYRELGYC